MRVEYVENETMPLSKIKYGECFRAGMYSYMKTRSGAFIQGGEPVNAVNLHDGGICAFSQDAQVIPVRLKIVKSEY